MTLRPAELFRRAFRVPWGFAMAAYAYLTVVFLQKFYTTHPIEWAQVRKFASPAMPPDSFSWANAQAVMGRVLVGHSLVLAWIACVAGVGLFLLPFLRIREPGRMDRLLVALGMGMAFAIPLWLGLGFAGLWHSSLAWVLVVPGCVSLWRNWPAPEAASSFPPEGGFGRGKWIPWACMAIIVPALALVAGATACPERFYDAMVYHIACPALFSMHHKVVALPNLMHSFFPMGMPMLYGWQWLMGGEPVTRVWRFWLTVLVLAVVFRMGAREGKPAAGAVAAALLASMPIFLLNAYQTSVDVELALVVLLACMLLQRGGRGMAVVAGVAVLAGAAWSVKITAVFWIPGLMIAAAMRGRGKKAALVVAAAAALWAAPWMVRNQFAVGNPVYPYLTEAFKSGRQWDPPRQARFLEQQAGRLVNKPVDLLKFPWYLGRGYTSEDYLGPALMIAAPILLLAIPVGPLAGVAAVVGGASLLLWFPVTNVPRFLLATWILLGILSVAALWEMGARRPKFAYALLGLLGVLCMANLASLTQFWRRNVDPIELLWGRESTDSYLDRKAINGYQRMVVSTGPELMGRGRILPVGETRGLYWPIPFVNHSVYDVQVFEEAVRYSRSPQEAAKRLRQRGVAYLFFNDIETSRMKFRYTYPMLEFNPRERGLISELWGRWISVKARQGWEGIYEVARHPRPAGRPAPQPLSFYDDDMRKEFEGWAEVTWQGPARIQVIKSIQQ